MAKVMNRKKLKKQILDQTLKCGKRNLYKVPTLPKLTGKGSFNSS